MKAVIMAGGKGTRLRPLTCDKPKPMVPLMNRSIMEHILGLLKQHGITDVLVTLQYLPDSIRDHFGNGRDFGANIEYFVEDSPLGTAGSVKNASASLDGTFIVISGDAFTDIDLQKAIDFHRSKEAAATIVLTEVSSPLEYGVVIADADGRITRFLEKPSWGEVFSDTVNTGIYILEPRTLDLFEAGKSFDFSKDLFPMLLERNVPLFGYVADGFWCDIGNIDVYRETHYELLDGKGRIVIPGNEIREGVRVGEGSEIHPTAEIIGPACIGEHCTIGPNAYIGEYTVIGNGVTVCGGASLKRSIVWENAYIGSGAELRGAIICSRAAVKSKASIFESAVIGSDSSVSEGSMVKPRVKIWPDKIVEAGAEVKQSLIWGTRSSKRIFGACGISGISNIEVTPEFAAKLGAAYGSCLGGGKSVAVSSDSSGISDVIKRAFGAGVLSAGNNVVDLLSMTTPAARYAVSELDVGGGVHIRSIRDTEPMLLIEFFDERGINIDKSMERRIENAFLCEDFIRADSARVGSFTTDSGAMERYLEGLLRSLDCGAIRKRGFRIATAYDSAMLSLILPDLFEGLGCEEIRAEAPDGLRDLAIRDGTDFGVWFDDNGERIRLVDGRGEMISDERLFGLLLLILLAESAGAPIPVPVTAPKAMERLAEDLRGKVIRTKTDIRSKMERGEAGCHLFFDGLASLAKILEYMTREEKSLSELIESIPEFFISKESILCPWEEKGRVMRTLIEEAGSETGNERVELLDGIKVYNDKGWALVLPDSERPLFHVYSEAANMPDAVELRDKYLSKIREIATH